MRRIFKTLLTGGTATAVAGAALAGALLIPADIAESADHLDPPTRTDAGFDTTPDVPADIADVFAWHSGTSTKFVMTFAGPVPTTAPMYYDRDVLYKINVSTTGSTTPDIVMKWRFGKGSGNADWGVRIEGLPGVSGALEGPVEKTLTSTNGIKTYTGLFDEPFFFDLIGFRETRSFATIRIRNDRNFFDGQNDTAMVIEIPDTVLRNPSTGAQATNLQVWGQTLRFGGNL